MAELVDAIDSGSIGNTWGFDSPWPHHNLNTIYLILCLIIFKILSLRSLENLF